MENKINMSVSCDNERKKDTPTGTYVGSCRQQRCLARSIGCFRIDVECFYKKSFLKPIHCSVFVR